MVCKSHSTWMDQLLRKTMWYCNGKFKFLRLLSLKRHLHHNITPEVSSCYVIDIMEDSGGSFAGPFSLARPLRLVGFAHCSRVLMLVLHLSQQAPNSAGKEQPETYINRGQDN
ncbi:hypothetical protein MUK42_16068 [Musa troglodytarum]|uniref:Uncharacterized protein n=1 Tax=Musa troglodytarum TaxID=320322 RepID=A0A9E7KWG4_9LILI|nr:hypothetical protein MUK42_16068 [Musa troglodytarum]